MIVVGLMLSIAATKIARRRVIVRIRLLEIEEIRTGRLQ